MRPAREIDALNERYDYPHIAWHDRDDMAERVGSRRYFGGSRDTATGHIQPMKYVVGLARAADQSGARLCEETPVTKVTANGTVRLETPRGAVTADRVLLALNGTHGDLHPALAARVLPIQSFIGATAPLPDDTDVLPRFRGRGGHAFHGALLSQDGGQSPAVRRTRGLRQGDPCRYRSPDPRADRGGLSSNSRTSR